MHLCVYYFSSQSSLSSCLRATTEMHRTALPTAALAAAAQAFDFVITDLTLDQHLTPPNIQLNFTVSAPGTVFEQGGPDPAQCDLTLYVNQPTTHLSNTVH